MVDPKTIKFCKRHKITPVYGDKDRLIGIDFSKSMFLGKKSVDRIRRITKQEWDEQSK